MAEWSNSAQGYGLAARLLHWVSAVMIIGLIIAGVMIDGVEERADKIALIRAHAQFGIATFLVMTVRLIWRLRTTQPSHLPGPVWQNRLATLAHWGLYLAVIGQMLGGMLTYMTKTGFLPVFGLLKVPSPIGKSDALHHLFEDLHGTGWLVVLAPLILHVAAVIYHQRFAGNDVLGRMVKGSSRLPS